jgi:hypothetical protein
MLMAGITTGEAEPQHRRIPVQLVTGGAGHTQVPALGHFVELARSRVLPVPGPPSISKQPPCPWQSASTRRAIASSSGSRPRRRPARTVQGRSSRSVPPAESRSHLSNSPARIPGRYRRSADSRGGIAHIGQFCVEFRWHDRARHPLFRGAGLRIALGRVAGPEGEAGYVR